MRPGIDEMWMAVALALSTRGTCQKMSVGCVLTDRRGRFLAGNYNGVAAGRPHCNEDDGGHGQFPYACAGAGSAPGSDLCEAVHAEQNALTWCLRPDSIHTCYTTISPCMRCVKQLLNTGCRRIVFLDEYTREPQAAALWRSAARIWQRTDEGAEARLRAVAAALGLKSPTRAV